MPEKKKSTTGAGKRAGVHKSANSRRPKLADAGTRRARTATKKTRAKAIHRVVHDTGTIGDAAIKVARSGARLARYSAKAVLAKAEDAWASAMHSVSERAQKIIRKGA
jgi:phage gp16-like protein